MGEELGGKKEQERGRREKDFVHFSAEIEELENSAEFEIIFFAEMKFKGERQEIEGKQKSRK